MLPFLVPTAFFVASFLAAAALTRVVLRELGARDIVDTPNARSSHTRPTPRGGGLAVTAVVLGAWLVAGPGREGMAAYFTLVAAALALAVVSWMDDRNSLSFTVRLAVHVAAVAAALAMVAPDFAWAGAWAAAALVIVGIGWVWFVNLYNFMDGIDGITGVETGAIGLGIFLVSLWGGLEQTLELRALAVAGAGLGFLVWNWHPARIFLGDVGSVPLGYLVGWLLIALALAGAWPAAVILPLYYLADTGLTLLRRTLAGKPFWVAHRDHFYQRVLPAPGEGHARVSLAVAILNAVLVIIAVWSLSQPLPALATAFAIVGAMLWSLERHAKPLGS